MDEQVKEVFQLMTGNMELPAELIRLHQAAQLLNDRLDAGPLPRVCLVLIAAFCGSGKREVACEPELDAVRAIRQTPNPPGMRCARFVPADVLSKHLPCDGIVRLNGEAFPVTLLRMHDSGEHRGWLRVHYKGAGNEQGWETDAKTQQIMIAKDLINGGTDDKSDV